MIKSLFILAMVVSLLLSAAPSIAVALAVPDAPTTITVTTSADDHLDGFSKKCSDVPAAECSLRRAINQAHGVSSAGKPVTIAFNIPVSDPGYDGTLKIWKITLVGSSAYDLRELYGQTIIDGTTQPGGRLNGPKIVVNGQGDHNYGLILRQGYNVVRGLAMQDFRTAHISVSSSYNTVENCWFGLSDDGMKLTAGNETQSEGGSGVALTASITHNTVRNNVFAGFFGVAAAIRGEASIFSGNLVGTRSDGTVPIPGAFTKHPCLRGAWVGGTGITVDGTNHQIGGPSLAEGNLFAGLFLDISATSTQRPAIDVGGTGHTIQNNVIGVDASRARVGVCGRGLDFGNGPKGMQVISNAIVETGLSGILLNGPSINGDTLRQNLITRAGPWAGALPGNSFAEGAIAFGPMVPAALKRFQPAAVTGIDGLTVSGTGGSGSACALCTVELFLDDTDSISETIRSLAVVTARADGTWTATLPALLGPGEGLRTLSSVPDTFTIIGLDTGTTSGLSRLYAPLRKRYLPVIPKAK